MSSLIRTTRYFQHHSDLRGNSLKLNAALVIFYIMIETARGQVRVEDALRVY